MTVDSQKRRKSENHEYVGGIFMIILYQQSGQRYGVVEQVLGISSIKLVW